MRLGYYWCHNRVAGTPWFICELYEEENWGNEWTARHWRYNGQRVAPPEIVGEYIPRPEEKEHEL